MPIDFSAIPTDSFLGRAIRAPLKVIPGTAVVRVLQGPLRGARWVVGSATHGCWLGSYELPKAQLFANTVEEGTTVFDIGAHVGYYSLIASRRVGSAGQVVAFEPAEPNLAHLRRHLALNDVSNVIVLNAAVSDRPGRGRFDPGSESSLGKLDPRGRLNVQTVAVDDLIAQGSLPSPNVLKLDIEGGEADALLGATRVLRDARPTVFLATHGAVAQEACLAVLHQEAYEVRTISDGHREIPDELVAYPGN